GKPPEWWEKQKGSRGIRRGQWYRLVFQFPIREHSTMMWSVLLQPVVLAAVERQGEALE
ncbi:transcriptional regulator, partial [Salmonella enterica subsp. enterica]|nr:transcriptional regulator [Salmonella enterica subsp. enterica]